MSELVKCNLNNNTYARESENAPCDAYGHPCSACNSTCNVACDNTDYFDQNSPKTDCSTLNCPSGPSGPYITHDQQTCCNCINKLGGCDKVIQNGAPSAAFVKCIGGMNSESEACWRNIQGEGCPSYISRICSPPQPSPPQPSPPQPSPPSDSDKADVINKINSFMTDLIKSNSDLAEYSDSIKKCMNTVVNTNISYWAGKIKLDKDAIDNLGGNCILKIIKPSPSSGPSGPSGPPLPTKPTNKIIPWTKDQISIVTATILKNIDTIYTQVLNNLDSNIPANEKKIISTIIDKLKLPLANCLVSTIQLYRSYKQNIGNELTGKNAPDIPEPLNTAMKNCFIEIKQLLSKGKSNIIQAIVDASKALQDRSQKINKMITKSSADVHKSFIETIWGKLMIVLLVIGIIGIIAFILFHFLANKKKRKTSHKR